MDNQFEITNIIDPVWIDRKDSIQKLTNSLSKPLTRVGEIESTRSLGNPVLQNYTRLQDVHSTLIGLVELDEIDKYLVSERGVRNLYFQDPENQRVVLRALGYSVENAIKNTPYDEQERMKYLDYQPFFNSVLDSLRRIDDSIVGLAGAGVQGMSARPNFVDECITSISESVNRLGGVRNFKILTGEIRRRVRDYLPELAKINNGDLIKELHSRLS